MSEYSRKNPSARYVELLENYKQLHKDGEKVMGLAAENTFPGFSVFPQVERIKRLCELSDADEILDYGAGKGKQYDMPMVDIGGGEKELLVDYWDVMTVHCFDPAYEPFSELPSDKFDAVISTDMLEHCPEEDVEWVVDEIFSFAKKAVFANVACYPAKKVLPNGENAHCTIKPPEWWVEKFTRSAQRNPAVKNWMLVVAEVVDGKMHETVYEG